jgi:hypothetical protein
MCDCILCCHPAYLLMDALAPAVRILTDDCPYQYLIHHKNNIIASSLVHQCMSTVNISYNIVTSCIYSQHIITCLDVIIIDSPVTLPPCIILRSRHSHTNQSSCRNTLISIRIQLPPTTIVHSINQYCTGTCACVCV